MCVPFLLLICTLLVVNIVVTGASEGIGRGYALEVSKLISVLLFSCIACCIMFPVCA